MRLMWLFLVAFVLVEPEVRAEGRILRIPLNISEAFPGREMSWPVTTGIPLPENLVKEKFEWRLVRRNGQPVPAVVRPVGWWRRTNSVQWLNLQFVALKGAELTLEIGDGLKPATPEKPIAISRNGNNLKVINGDLQAIFTSTGTAELTQLHISGKAVIQSTGLPMQSFVNQKGQAYVSGRKGEERKIEIEFESAFQSVVKCTGHYLGQNGEKAARYTTRYHFFAGLPFIKVSHAFLILVDTEGLQFQNILWQLPLAVPERNRIVIFDASSEFDENHFRRKWLPGTISYSMAQEVYRHYGNDEARFRIYAADAAGEEQAVYESQRGGQVAHVAADAVALTVGLKGFWQQFPKELQVTKDRLAVHLWSARGGNLDFRVEGCRKFWGERLLAFWHTNDPRKYLKTYMPDRNGYDSAKGLEKSHEIWLWPQVAEVSAKQLNEFARLIEQPVLAIADPEWNCASGVFGPIAPKDPSAAPEAEKFLDQLIDRRREAADAWGDYGWFAYGFNDHSGWASHKFEGEDQPRLLATPYRFTHATYGHLRSMWAMYFRSGDRKILDYLLARLYHHLDIRVKHVADKRWPKGAWGGYVTLPIAWWTHDPFLFNTIDISLQEVLWAYNTTGDERWREWAEAWTEAAHEFSSKPKWPEPFLGVADKRYTASYARQVFFFLNSLVSAYSHNGNSVLIERARALVSGILDPNSPTGFRRTMDNHILAEPYYWLNPLNTYYQQTGDERVRKACKRLTEFLCYAVADSGGRDPKTGDLIWGYALNNDAKYLSVALLNLKNVIRFRSPQFAAPLHTRDGARSLGFGSEDKQLWDGLPRLTWALKQQRKSGKPIPPVVGLPGVSESIAFEKAAGKALFAEIKSSKPPGKILDPNGKEVPKAWISSSEYEGFWWKKYFITRVKIPAAARAGPYLVLGDSPLKLLMNNAARYAAWVPGGFPIKQAGMTGPLCIPAKDGKLSLRVRFPRKISFRNIKGDRLTPSKWDGQMMGFSGLAEDEVILAETTDKNYLALLNIPVNERWVSHGDPSRLFLPKVKLPELASSPKLDPKTLFVQGVDPGRPDDRALQLSAGRTLVIPTTVEIEGEEAVIFPGAGKEGTVEFWYSPLWNPKWHPKPYYDLFLIEAGSFAVRYAGHLVSGENVSADAWGPLNRGWCERRTPFRQGKWHHIAVSWWPWDKAGNKILLLLFIDGIPQKGVRTGNYVASTGGWAPNPRMTLKPFVQLGGRADALFDEVRVSSIARYKEMKQIVFYEFDPYRVKPSRKPFELDKHTHMLMHFDGDTRVLSSKAPDGVEAVIRGMKK